MVEFDKYSKTNNFWEELHEKLNFILDLLILICQIFVGMFSGGLCWIKKFVQWFRHYLRKRINLRNSSGNEFVRTAIPGLSTFREANYSEWIPKTVNTVTHFRIRILLWINKKIAILGFSEYYRLLLWVRTHISSSHNITNFVEDWADGTALCALMENLVPGCCPRYDTLHPQHKAVNLDLGLRLAEVHLGVVTHLKSEEIAEHCILFEKEIQGFIAELKDKREKLKRKKHEVHDQPYCFAKGLGLLMANKEQKTSFIIYLQTKHLSYIVIEIHGPNSDHHTEVITNRSPRKKISIEEETPIEKSKNISFEYDIFPEKILVCYTPRFKGRYVISIIYKGRPIVSSPFNVKVYDDLPKPAKKPNYLTLPKSSHMKHIHQDDEMNYPPLICQKPAYMIVFRKYANILLKCGEQLPPDPRAWQSLTGPAVSEDEKPIKAADLRKYLEQNKNLPFQPSFKPSKVSFKMLK